MTLHRAYLLSGAALLGAASILSGCKRSSATVQETARASTPTDSSSTEAVSLPQQIADVVVQLDGGIHTGFRFMHAKGIVVSGAPCPHRSRDAS